MKVLMINTINLAVNGITTCIVNYSKMLNNIDVTCHVMAPNVLDDGIKKKLINNNIYYYDDMKRKHVIKYFFKLLTIIKKEKYDIVHIHGNSTTMSIELLAAFFAGCKVRVAHSHNTTCNHWVINIILKPLFNIICNGRFACGEDAGKWLYGKRDFYIINNGIELDKYVYDEKKIDELKGQLKIKGDELIVCHVGRFNHQKNHEYIIRLASELSKMIPFKLFLIGTGMLKDDMEQRVQELHLKEYVRFMGDIDNVIDFMMLSDVFILPSKYEGLPFVLVEAQAAGLPCLVSTNVALEANLTQTISYLSLDEISIWIDEIIKKEKLSIETRQKEIKNNHEKLNEMGYDINTNTEYIKTIYKSLIEKFV